VGREGGKAIGVVLVRGLRNQPLSSASLTRMWRRWGPPTRGRPTAAHLRLRSAGLCWQQVVISSSWSWRGDEARSAWPSRRPVAHFAAKAPSSAVRWAAELLWSDRVTRSSSAAACRVRCLAAMIDPSSASLPCRRFAHFPLLVYRQETTTEVGRIPGTTLPGFGSSQLFFFFFVSGTGDRMTGM